ncbi:MAG: hypothetical protein AAGA18_13505 [Verrucomicrobiota bacterium]
MKAIIVNLGCLGAGAIIAIGIMSHLKMTEPEQEASFNLEGHLRDVGMQHPAKKSQANVQRFEKVVDRDETFEEKVAGDENELNSFANLMKKVFSGDANEDEQLAFWKEIRKSDTLDEILNNLKNDVNSNPNDLQARSNLAKVYMAKLHSGSFGPEMNILAARAEEQWKEILKIDPNNWKAQNSLAVGLSWYPENMNKIGEAIGEFEKLLIIQESQQPEKGFKESYLRLSDIYLKNNDPAGALETLERGLTIFPNDQKLKEQLSSFHSQYEIMEGP